MIEKLSQYDPPYEARSLSTIMPRACQALPRSAWQYIYSHPQGIRIVKKITLQQIFDAAWQTFIVEHQPPATGPDTRDLCQYLTSDGRKCAIGLVLPDGHPSQRYEQGFGSLVECYPELFDKSVTELSPAQLAFFQRSLHDHLQFFGIWQLSANEREAKYREIAAHFDLTIPGE